MGGRLRRSQGALTEEDVLSVAAPDLVVPVLVDEGGRAGGVASYHVEACLGEPIERLL